VSTSIWAFRLAAVIYLASLTAACVDVAANPEWNLDGLFYSALMQVPRGALREQHARIYADVESQLSKRDRDALVRSSRYRRALSSSAELFALQLPFYTSKPLYVWIGRALCAAGVSPLAAPHVISAAAFVLIAMLLPVLSIRAGAPRAPVLAYASLVIWLPQLRELGALATPDALATALLTAAAVMACSNARRAVPFLAAAVLARPDAAILAIGLLGGVGLHTQDRARRRELLATAVLMALLPAGVAWASGGYGWQTVMRHTFIDRITSEAALRSGFGVHDYIVALGRGLRGHMAGHPARVLPYAAIAVISGVVYQRSGRHEAKCALALLAGIWTTSIVRFLIVPILADRFLAPAYVITLALAPALLAAAIMRPSSAR
jgi:hypothetical protein